MGENLPVRARYTNGKLELKKALDLPEGAQVWVRITPIRPKPARRRIVRRRNNNPTRSLAPRTLESLVGLFSLGGDALADSEALYDGQ